MHAAEAAKATAEESKATAEESTLTTEDRVRRHRVETEQRLTSIREEILRGESHGETKSNVLTAPANEKIVLFKEQKKIKRLLKNVVGIIGQKMFPVIDELRIDANTLRNDVDLMMENIIGFREELEVFKGSAA